MRKFFALVATMAMVLSMFAGIAFADPAVASANPPSDTRNWTINLDDAVHASSSAIVLTGNVTYQRAVRLLGVVIRWEDRDAELGTHYTIDGAQAFDGGFAVMITNPQAGMNTITAKAVEYEFSTDYYVHDADAKVVLNDPTTVRRGADPIVFTGSLKDNAGEIITLGEQVVAVKDLNTAVVAVTNGEFTITIPGNTAVGEYTVTATVDGVALKVAEFEILASTVNAKVKLDSATFTQLTDKDIITVSGSINEWDGSKFGDIVKKDFLVTVANRSAYAIDGVFSIRVPGNIALGDHNVTVVALDGFSVAPSKITIMPPGFKVVSGSLNIDWTATASDYRLVGELPLSMASHEVALAYQNADGTFAVISGTTTTVLSSGQFVINKAKNTFEKPGKIYLVTRAKVSSEKWSQLAAGEIAKVDISSRVSVDPAAVVYGIGKQTVTVKINEKDLRLDGGELSEGLVKYGVTFTDRLNNTVAATLKSNTVKDNVRSLVYELDLTKSEYGKVTVDVSRKWDGVVAYEAEAALTVGRPSGTVVIGTPQSDITVNAGWEGKPEVRYFLAGNADHVTAHKLVITASGAGVDIKDLVLLHNNADHKLVLAPKHAGVIEGTIKAYDAANKLVATESFSVTVKGATVEATPAELELKKAVDIVLVIKNEAGNAINNAEIYFGATKLFDPATTSVNNGQYTIKIAANHALVQSSGTKTLEVRTVAGTKLAEVDLTVLGVEAYTVTTGIEGAVLSGEQMDFTITVKEGETTVSAAADKFEIWYDGKLVNAALTRKGTAYQMPVLAKSGEYTLVYRNGDKYGKTTFEVVLPVLSVDVAKVTNNVESNFAFTVIDPRDNSVLDWNVIIDGNAYVTIEALEQSGTDIMGNVNLVIGGDDTYEIMALVTADYEAAAKAKKVPALVFSVETELGTDLVIDGTMEVADATFSVVPANPVVGISTTVTFKLVDANGEALVGYEVFRGATKIGKTNEDGELAYVARLNDVANFTVNLDVEDAVKSVTVTPVDDTVAPVFGDVPATVDVNFVELVITDNVRVAEVYVNNVKRIFVPGAEVKIRLTLNEGENVFHVIALDSNNNGVEEVFTINYVKPVQSIRFQVGVAGDGMVAAERKGEHIFVPVRMFQDLGATFAWDQVSRTATFTLNGTEVKVTVDSTTAMVNGQAVEMPAVPYIVESRTMVPIRFISQSLGWRVDWEPGDIVTITLP